MARPNPRDPMLPMGSRKCQCSVCKEYFSGEGPFNAHRVGEVGQRRCLTSQERQIAGLYLDADGYWRGRRIGKKKRSGKLREAA